MWGNADYKEQRSGAEAVYTIVWQTYKCVSE